MYEHFKFETICKDTNEQWQFIGQFKTNNIIAFLSVKFFKISDNSKKKTVMFWKFFEKYTKKVTKIKLVGGEKFEKDIFEN